MKTINSVKIQLTLEAQSNWRRQTRDELKAAVLEMIGQKEWHFPKADLFPNTSYKMICAGFRVQEGELYWLSADGLCRRSFLVNKQTYEVSTWHWQKMILKNLDWWIDLYRFAKNVKHTTHDEFTPEYVARDYSANIEAYAERYFGIKLNGAKTEDGIAIRL